MPRLAPKRLQGFMPLFAFALFASACAGPATESTRAGSTAVAAATSLTTMSQAFAETGGGVGVGLVELTGEVTIEPSTIRSGWYDSSRNAQGSPV